MLAKTGLLVVSNPKHIGKLLADVQNTVKNTLYIQLLSALNDTSLVFHPGIFSTPPKLSKTIYCIYSQATQYCGNLDVRVLLSNLRRNIPEIKTQNSIDVVIFDKKYTNDEVALFIRNKVTNISTEHNVVTVDCDKNNEVYMEADNRDDHVYRHVCLGGTFDRLHTAHKLLLSDAVLRSSEKVTIGITEENMIQSKTLWELIQDVDTRINNVNNFLADICPDLEYHVCKISDPFGPAIVDPTMEMILVSEETIRGGAKINEIRKERQMNQLQIVPIPFIQEPNPQTHEEKKVSSSNARLRLLGTVLKPIERKNIPNKPYVIGLTGGIASGKSGVALHLQNLGVPIIDCDKLAHKMYQPDGHCYQKVVDCFGPAVVTQNGEIDRKALGAIVFQNCDQMQKLNEIMWPAMAEDIQVTIRSLNKDVVCVDAAILVKAGWDSICHEVWTTFVPPNEAIERLKTRNNLTEEQAKSRLAAQQSNKDYISQANVVFSPLWEVEYTKLQVEKAWNLLQKRLPS